MSDRILYDYLMRFVGRPYKWGGDDAIKGFDCSGLVIEFLIAASVAPHGYDASSSQLVDFVKSKGGERTSLPKFGSLVFYGIPSVNHVAIALDQHLMIEAGGGDSTVVDEESAAKKNAFIKVRPIVYRKGLNQIVHPKFFWE